MSHLQRDADGLLDGRSADPHYYALMAPISRAGPPAGESLATYLGWTLPWGLPAASPVPARRVRL